MSKSIIIVGAGPGFSLGVAEKFGKQGYVVGLISRNGEKLRSVTESLSEQGIVSFFSAANAAIEEELEYAISDLRTRMGGVSVLFYNAAVLKTKDIWLETTDILIEDFRLNVAHALFCAQLLHEDLKNNHGAVLLTGGSLAKFPSPQYGSLAIGKAGILSLAIQLNKRLKDDGIFVGTITINGSIQPSSPTHSPEILADKLWNLFQNRTVAEIFY
jgi:short-subunit dehydrogenase